MRALRGLLVLVCVVLCPLMPLSAVASGGLHAESCAWGPSLQESCYPIDSPTSSIHAARALVLHALTSDSLLAAKGLTKGAQEKLSEFRAKQLEDLMRKDGTDIHDFKGRGGGKRDFFVDKESGDIYLKGKDGSGPGEFTGYNVSEFE